MDDKHRDKMLGLGRRMFNGDVTFIKGAVSIDTLPPMDFGEVAFAGRSNVGKSSLINGLTQRKNLARTSNTPGRTQELNYFEVGVEQGAPVFIVDLPGYGYAKVSRSKVNEWVKVIKKYLAGRANLRRVFLLIDSRHGLKDSDKEIMTMLDVAAVSYQLILTKLDKLKVVERNKIVEKTQVEAVKFIACHPIVIGTSSEKGWGMDDLRAEIAELATN